MICFVLRVRVDGVLCGPSLAWAHACVICLSLTVLGLVGGAPGGGATCASLGAGRVATIAALLYIARR